VVHQVYLVKYYHNVYAAAFMAGDCATNLFASALAIAQHPELKADNGRRFPPSVFYISFLPIVVCSYSAYVCIDYFRLGALSEEFKAGVSGESLVGDRTIPGAAHQIQLVALRGDSQDGTAIQDVDREMDEQRSQPSFLHVSRPCMAAALCFIGFCLTITCWGIGNSILPFACAQTSCLDGGKACVFHASVGSNCAQLIASIFASLPLQPSHQILYAPVLAYVVFFVLLCLAVTWGGSWADPLGFGEKYDLCGSYIVSVVFLVRFLQMFVVVIRQRLIQSIFVPQDWERVNSLFVLVGIVANLIGVFAMSFVLPGA